MTDEGRQQLDALILATEQKARAEMARADVERQRVALLQNILAVMEILDEKLNALLEIQRIIIPRVLARGDEEAERLTGLLRAIGAGPKVNTDFLLGGTRLSSSRDLHVRGDVVGRDKEDA